MKKSILISLMLIIVLGAFVACGGKYDPASDFRVRNLEDGKSVEIIDYVGNKQNVRIPPKIDGKVVANIGNRAFRNKDLNSVSIPNTVTYIGIEAFSGNHLLEINIPNSVKEIKNFAFTENMITKVKIGANVELSAAFHGDFYTVYYNNKYNAGTYIYESNIWKLK